MTTNKPHIIRPDLTGIPAELREPRRWVTWKLELRGDNWTKTPYNAMTGAKADSTNSNTWTTFNGACRAYDAGQYDGIGFVLGDGWAGVDLDNSLDSSGNPLPWALEIVDMVGGYCEISPSGTGLKLFVRGALPSGPEGSAERRRVRKWKSGKVELYDAGRYFTTTGMRLGDYINLTDDRSESLRRLHDRLFPKQERTTPRAESSSTMQLDDAEIIRRAESSKNGDKFKRLWAGDLADAGGDHSSADLALCNLLAFWTGPDEGRIDSLFRQSGLYRQKWEREDYRASTIGAALRDRTEYFQPHGRGRQNGHMPSDNGRPEQQHGSSPVRRYKLSEMREKFPKLREPIVDGLLRVGETCNIVAAPKSGKSWLSYSLAISVITGRPWFGRFEINRGDVLLVDNELHKETISFRVPAVGNAMRIPYVEYGPHLEIWPIRGDMRSLEELQVEFDYVKPGKFRMIIFDSKYRLMGNGVAENSNEDQTRFYNLVDRIAEQTQSAIVLVNHPTKGLQGGKSISDIGAGGGAQSRATDTHLVIREHEDPGCAVLDAIVRSFPPVEPLGLRWEFPVFVPDDAMDVGRVKGSRPDRERKQSKSDADGIDKIREALANGAMTAGRLADITGMDRKRAVRLLGIMRDSGSVSCEHYDYNGRDCTQYMLAGDGSF